MKPPVEDCSPTTVLCIILSVRCHLVEWVSTSTDRTLLSLSGDITVPALKLGRVDGTPYVHVLVGLMIVIKMCWGVQETVGWAVTTASSALTS